MDLAGGRQAQLQGPARRAADRAHHQIPHLEQRARASAGVGGDHLQVALHSHRPLPPRQRHQSHAGGLQDSLFLPEGAGAVAEELICEASADSAAEGLEAVAGSLRVVDRGRRAVSGEALG